MSEEKPVPTDGEWAKMSMVNKVVWKVERKIGRKIHPLTRRYIAAYGIGHYLENWVNNYGDDTFVKFEEDLQKAIKGEETNG